jgi:GNAT superfamily N-acetyltransferase
VLEHEITREIPGQPKLKAFDCEINIVHIRHALQGKGLGRALMAEIVHHWQVGGKRALMLWAFRDNDYRKLYDKLGGTLFAEGVDEGAPDVAYGWQDLNALIAACARR